MGQFAVFMQLVFYDQGMRPQCVVSGTDLVGVRFRVQVLFSYSTNSLSRQRPRRNMQKDPGRTAESGGANMSQNLDSRCRCVWAKAEKKFFGPTTESGVANFESLFSLLLSGLDDLPPSNKNMAACLAAWPRR